MAAKRDPSQKRPSSPVRQKAAAAIAEQPAPPAEFRLQKFLASAGLGSRRQCEELIRTGRITIDGLPIDNPGINVNPLKQVVEYDGERLKPERLKYFVLNKPKGVLCTNHDPAGRTRVIDLFQKERVRLFPVGRLDEESEGLLIVTNDGDLAHQLAHPRYRIYRTYLVQVVGIPTNETLQQLKDGMYFRDGKFKVMNVRRLGKQGKSCFLEVVLGQGHNREVRRLFARVGHKVLSLERVAFGPIKLQKLKTGQYRELTNKELQDLRDILTRNRSTPGHEFAKQDEEKPKERPRRPSRGPKRDSQAAPEANAGGQSTGPKKRIRRPGATPARSAGSTEGPPGVKPASTRKFAAKPAGAGKSGENRTSTPKPGLSKPGSSKGGGQRSGTAKHTSAKPGAKRPGKKAGATGPKSKPRTHDFH